MVAEAHSDPTFRSYSAEEAKAYAKARLSYPQELYDVVLKHHEETGGQFDLLLDVGCGPGTATRDVALSFDQAIGCDPGEQMISAAKSIGGTTKSGSAVRYVVSPAEDLSHIEDLGLGSVDLLSAAMAAHWFDMEKFWTEAAKVLKPGGTVALWTCSSSYCHPSTPNASQVMKVMLRMERETLLPYALLGSLLSQNQYDDLPLPWNLSPPVKEFPKSGFIKHSYDRDGVLSNGISFFGGGRVFKLSDISHGMWTSSMVTRWRVANPELVGTDRDVVKVFVGELQEALGGQDWVEGGSGTAILLFKKLA